MAKTLTLTDFGDIAKYLYSQDPDWSWLNNVQKFVSWEHLPAGRQLELITAVQGLAAFINAFERDIPLSALIESLKKLSIHGASIDTIS
jgi:hypothetical protein